MLYYLKLWQQKKFTHVLCSSFPSWLRACIACICIAAQGPRLTCRIVSKLMKCDCTREKLCRKKYRTFLRITDSLFVKVGKLTCKIYLLSKISDVTYSTLFDCCTFFSWVLWVLPLGSIPELEIIDFHWIKTMFWFLKYVHHPLILFCLKIFKNLKIKLQLFRFEFSVLDNCG